MAVNQLRILELALDKLLEEKRRVEGEISEIRTQMREQQGGTTNVYNRVGRTTGTKKAAKKIIAKKKSVKKKTGDKGNSSTMRKLWAETKAAGYTSIKDYRASHKNKK